MRPRSGAFRSTAHLPVVVTGAAGFVGAHLVRALLHAGRAVIATDVPPSPPAWVTAGLVDPGDLRYLRGDLLDDRTLGEIVDLPGERLDFVNVAALTRFHGERMPAPSEALHAFAVNAVAPWRLCVRLAEDGRLRRLVQVSTRSVFGRRPTTDEAIPEDSAYVPAGVYGASKAAGEVGVVSLRQELGLDAVVARITGVFGPWQGPRSPVAAILDAAAHCRPLSLDAGMGQAYELTYVKDTVRGIATLLHAEHSTYSLYHLSSGTMATLADVADAARSAAPGLEVSLSDQEAPGAWRRTPLAVGRAADDLEFQTRWTLDDAVADAIRAERTGVYGREALEDADMHGGVVV